METLISEMIGRSYPPTEALGNRLRRSWILRTAVPVPSDELLRELEAAVVLELTVAIREAYATVATEEQLAGTMPALRLLRLGHLVARIEYAGPETNIGDSDMVAHWGALQSIDRMVPLDELQGLPAGYWVLLRGSRARDGAG